MAAVEEGVFISGDNESGSAKRRKQNAYAKDLELQMREKEAAKLRERYQDMAVDASGWLDPEKRPERLKPLGGDGFITSRSARDSKVRPYHTLFLYGKMPEGATSVRETWGTPRDFTGLPRAVDLDAGPRIRNWHLNLDTPAGLMHHPLTEATAGPARPNESVHHAYNFYATRDIDRPAGYGSLVQPLVVPYVDNRPIIMPGRYEQVNEYHPKYNPFDHNNDGLQRDIRTLLGMTQLERERNKNHLARDHDDYLKRMRRELEDERRRLMDQESDARRRVDHMRRDLDDRRKEWERQMREAQRAKKDAELPPKTAPINIRPPSTTLLSDMDDTRKRLIDERKKIEELLKAQTKAPDYTEVKVLKRPPPPPTPTDSDMANRRVLEEFNFLKHKEIDNRKAFRRMYPELPETNMKLETQQRALLRQQEEALRTMDKDGTSRRVTKNVTYEDGLGRPDWMDKNLTPFPHILRKRDRLYTTSSLDGDLDRIYRRAERREFAIDTMNVADSPREYDKLRLRSHRPSSAETLTDDTWLRPASASVL